MRNWICYQSILEQNPMAQVYVLCMDDETLRAAQGKKCCAFSLKDLERRYPQLLDIKTQRPWCAYTQTCKVFLPSYVVEKYGEDILVYVDNDMMFFANFEVVEQEFKDHSFMVTSREQHPPPPQGRFNGGFFMCRNDTRCATFLKWWQEQVIDWCLWEPGPQGRFTEEGYLNIIYEQPEKFKGIHVCRHPGVNLAFWNVAKHNVEKNDKHIIIDEKYELICFHYKGFSGKKLEEPLVSNKVLDLIYRPYYNRFLEDQ